MKSIAFPQQWSLVPGHVQSLVQKISRILPGCASTVFCAPLTATALHAPTGGMRGGGKPPLVPGTQHLKSVGPGHKPVRVLPLHEEAKRQLPPLPQEVLVQHLISAGRPGQAFWIWVPSLEVQSAVGMQTPGAPPAPVQGPLATARSTR